jgi:sulfate adenylyltransferase
MTRADYLGVLDTMRLDSGAPWSIPIILAVKSSVGSRLREGSKVLLRDARGQERGVLELRERYTYDPMREAHQVYRTLDTTHPGVRRLHAQGDVLLGGPIWAFDAPAPGALADHTLTPAQARAAFAARGWRTTVGFQTCGPIHRAHEYIQKCALEIVDGLFLQPLVDETEEDDLPATVRMLSYQVLLRDYFPPQRALLGALPAWMRYAGPREAVFHALIRRNYGCSHFIVGRDHAGVGNFYGTYESQRIFSEFGPDELGITPLFFEHAFFCHRCMGMATSKTCSHGDEHHVVLSGTRVRTMLRSGRMPPPEFSRPEVAEVLIESMSEALVG